MPMNKVRIQITSIERESDDHYRACMRIGDIRADAEIVTECIEDDMEGFNFSGESLFSASLFYCGLGKQFNVDFGRFCDGEVLEFPLDYGDFEQPVIDMAIAMHKRAVKGPGPNWERL